MRAQLEAERQARQEAERKAKEEAERRKQEEAERGVREETERRAKEEAERKEKEEEERRKKEEAERREREDAERRAKEEEEHRAREETERRKKEEAQRREREEAERRSREDAERRAKEEDERRKNEEAERREREEAERRKNEEAERREREEAERRAREEAERKAKEEEERRAREEAEHRKQEEAERRAREEAERRAREEEGRRAREEAERRAKEDAERKAKEEEERRAREEAERRKKEETERRAREETERRAKEEEERREREEAEREAKEQEAREETERQAEREAEEKREESKARARMEAEAAAQARKDARARERALAKDRKAAEMEEPSQPEEPMHPEEPLYPAEPEPKIAVSVGKLRRKRNWARTFALGLFVVLIVAIAAIHVVPLDVGPYEKAARERLGAPVRIGSIHYSLFPRPHLRFEKISIGTEPQLRIGSMKAVSELGSMFAPRKDFTSIEIEGLVLPQAAAARALWGKGSDDAMRMGRVLVRSLKLELNGMVLPPLDVEASFGPGGLEKAQLANVEKGLSVSLQSGDGKTQVEITAKQLVLPFAENIVLDEFSGKGTLSPQEFTLREFDARVFDGALTGNARLSWRDAWSFEGEFDAKRMNAAKLAAPVLSGGQLEGKGVYSMRAPAPDKLMAAARLEGSFSVQKGTVANVDLTRTLQGASGSGGSTLFSEMNGSVVADANHIQLRQIRLLAGLLSANGAAEVDAKKNLSGRLQIELRSQTTQFRANLAISGTLAEPQFRRSN